MASGIISVGMRQHDHLGLSAFLLGVCALSFVVLVALNVWRIVAVPLRRSWPTSPTPPGDSGSSPSSRAATSSASGSPWTATTRSPPSCWRSAWSAPGWCLGYVVPWTLGPRPGGATGASQEPTARGSSGWSPRSPWRQSAATLQPAMPTAARCARRRGRLRLVGGAVPVPRRGHHGGPPGCFSTNCGRPTSARRTGWRWVPPRHHRPRGRRIVEMVDTPMVDAVRGLVAGVSVTIWLFGSWLIPVLVAAGWWRHRTPPRAAALRAVAVEHGLSAGHVLRRRHLPLAGRRATPGRCGRSSRHPGWRSPSGRS